MQERLNADAADLDYGSISALLSALQARKISASELLDHTIARIEALDGRINAIIVRDFDRAREAARAADEALARRERLPLLGIPRHFEGTVQRRRAADDMGLSALQGFPTGGGCAYRLAVEGGRRRPHRQDKHPDRPQRFPELQRDLRDDQQPVGPRPRPAAPRADRVRRWPRASVRSRSARISAARSACLRISAACSDTSRASAWCRCADTACRRRRPSLARAISPSAGRWRAPHRTLRCRLT